MKKKEPNKRLSGLFHEDLSPEEADSLYSRLLDEGTSDQDIEAVEKINLIIGGLEDEKPSSSMDEKFYEMLADENGSSKAYGKQADGHKWFSSLIVPSALRIAAGIALFLLGWFMSSRYGYGLNNENEVTKLSGEMKELRETLVLTMMNQNSSVDRIRAVNMVNELESADDKIIASLLSALNSDNNDNVRLLALEALLKYSDNPAVREGLVASIKNQTSPMIQLRMAEVMIALEEKSAAPELQKILTNGGLNYMVRNKINEAVSVLL